ncbi:proline--tRNA ligase [Hyphomonas johnsonii]|uniref:Proline--tRNA ligase n=1 Tax=Hyphomonas johnsonii MHS-2 TaxID=1280950 RepID=A0A059FV19_9PROT|nr:proline--tRNA ligase [Hyphomonas johnsonii]KCZ94366.1 prolyl-tRNA ligase [Hyphomonas johnsonii MHS-2]
MRLSRYFLPVTKDAPADAAIASHKLMLRTGMVRQNGAGIYSWLPMGFRVLKKIEQIVREEMDRAGAVEMLMPTLQQADLWRESGRYEAYGKEMLRIQDRHERDMLYGPTNEELVTDVFRSYVKSYKQLPLVLYHQQWKFRDEVRPRFGVMRGREFLMKDAYSFDLTEEDARVSYRKMFCAYLNAFGRMGLTAVPMRADTGPIGGDMSHEFIILADTGESAVFCDKALLDMPAPGLDLDFDGDLTAEVEKRTQYYAATEEMHDADAFAALPADRQVSARGIEVGHIFNFGTKYSVPMNAVVQTTDGQMVPVQMGSYGIGVSRLVGGIIEACHDENGIVWPESVAPWQVGLINMRVGDAACDAVCERIYQALQAAGREVLYDDTDERAGGKFARMDLIGLPWQTTVGPRGVADGKVEVKNRKTGEKHEVSIEDMLNQLDAQK